MKRGELWTIAGGSDYAGKPRPALVLQEDAYSDTESLTICPLTREPDAMPLFRIAVAPTPENGLQSESRIMVDKISTISRRKVGKRIGVLGSDELSLVEVAVMSFLGLTG